MTKTDHTLARLRARLVDLAVGGRIAIAFSGGLDSRFLAHVAQSAGLRPLLLHVTGPHIAAAEGRYAREWAAAREMDLRCLRINLLALPEVAVNDRMRCYHCKKALFTRLKREARNLPLCDGTQAGDSGGYRPGVAALRELEVLSPLASAGLAKRELRRLAAQTGMDRPDQRARPCLLTRFAYMVRPSREDLVALDNAEKAVESVLAAWAGHTPDAVLPDFRLRRVSREGIELHLTPLSPEAPSEKEPEAARLPAELAASLEEAVRRAIGRPLAAIAIMPELSGYFDRE